MNKRTIQAMRIIQLIEELRELESMATVEVIFPNKPARIIAYFHTTASGRKIKRRILGITTNRLQVSHTETIIRILAKMVEQTKRSAK